jgi:hypothetical protein
MCEQITEGRLKRSIIDRDWEDIEKDLLSPGKRLEDQKGDVKIIDMMDFKKSRSTFDVIGFAKKKLRDAGRL